MKANFSSITFGKCPRCITGDLNMALNDEKICMMCSHVVYPTRILSENGCSICKIKECQFKFPTDVFLDSLILERDPNPFVDTLLSSIAFSNPKEQKSKYELKQWLKVSISHELNISKKQARELTATWLENQSNSINKLKKDLQTILGETTTNNFDRRYSV